MRGATGKRRRPRWFGGATIVVTWALFCLSPSAASLSRGGNSWKEGAFLQRVLAPRKRDKPQTVFLKETKYSRKVRGRRRLDFDFTFSEDTASPTFFPAESPSVSPRPSSAPVLVPSIGPSVPPPSHGSHQDREGDQLLVVHIPVTSSSTKDPSSPVQPLVNFAAVPVGFDVLLETDSQQDLTKMAQEARTILQDHLTRSCREGFADEEGVFLRSVDLSVTPFLTPPPSRRARALRQIERLLQLSRAITLETRGVAGFQVNRNAVDPEMFLGKVNTIINESVQPQQLMDLFQNSTSGLTEFRVASVTNAGTPSEKEKSEPPTLAEMIIAFVLIAIMLLGLGAYAYIFYRKRQKRIKRRKQFGVGHKTPSPYKGPPKTRPHGASITPTAKPGQMATSQVTPSHSTYPRVVNTVSSESSYKGLGSESEEDDADIFAKELRLAASLDRRAWDDFQYRAEQANSGESPGNDPVYNSQSDVYRDLSQMESASAGMEMEEDNMGYRLPSKELPSPPGAVGLTVTGDTVSIQNSRSFPYGDEQDNEDYDPALYGVGGGVRQDASRGDFMTEGQQSLEGLERDDSSGGWRMTNAASSELKDEAQPTQGSPRPFSFLYHATESNLEPETHSTNYQIPMEGDTTHQPAENASDPTTAGAFRGSPMSHSWSTNPRPGSSTENGTTAAIRGSPRGSPQNSSLNTRAVSQDGSPPTSLAFGSTGAVNEDVASAADSEADSALVTADIVKEVQRLSQFVKTYERKKENRSRLDQDRDDNNVSNSLTSSMGYDSLMDQVHSLQNVVDPAANVSISRKVTSESFTNSPERAMARQFEGVESMQSSDSSDIETMESDDLSRRLGITPFSVQRPVSYQNPAVQNPPVHSIPHISSAYYQRAASPPQQKPDGGHNDTYQQITPRFSNQQSSQQSSLSALRHSDANILDGSMGGPSDEFQLSAARKNMEAPSDEFQVSEARTKKSDDRPFNATLGDPSTVLPRKRSNGNLSRVISMFEEKVKEPIYPPHESWQYNY